MDVVHRRRVVVFENVAADAVDDGRIERIESLRPRKKARRGLSGERLQGADRLIDCRFAAASDCTTDEVQ